MGAAGGEVFTLGKANANGLVEEDCAAAAAAVEVSQEAAGALVFGAASEVCVAAFADSFASANSCSQDECSKSDIELPQTGQSESTSGGGTAAAAVGACCFDCFAASPPKANDD